MTRRDTWHILPLLLGVALASPALGQQGDLRIVLDAEAGAYSDGNYRQIARNEEEAEEDAMLARGRLNLQLSYTLFDRLYLALGYSPSYERVFNAEDADGEEQELSGTGHRLDFGVRGDLTRRLAFHVRERLVSAPNLDLELPATARGELAATRRGDQIHHGLDVSLNHQLTQRASVLAGLSHSLREFEDPALFDAETLGANLGAAYNWTERQVFEATAGTELFEFENGRETDVQTLGLGYIHPLGESAEFHFEAGIFSVETVRRGRAPVVNGEPGTGPTEPRELRDVEATGWRGAVSFSQRRRLFGWDAGYRHDVRPGYGLGRETEVDNLFAGISTSIGRRLLLGLDGNASWHGDVEDDDTGGLDGGDEGRDSGSLMEFAAGTARVSWAVLPSLRLTGGYSRVWQRSDVEPFDDLSYDRYFLGLAFRIFERGETPHLPGDLERRGEPTDDEDEESDDQ